MSINIYVIVPSCFSVLFNTFTGGDLIDIIHSDTMKIQIKKSTMIQPADETPKHSLRSTALDLLSRAAHVPGLFFFRQGQPNVSSNFFEAGLLKEALSKVLVPFYPMAGRLGRDENGRIEIKCNGEGILLVEAETNCVLDDLGDFESAIELQKLSPSVDYTNDISSYPLLVTQVNDLRESVFGALKTLTTSYSSSGLKCIDGKNELK